MSSVGTLGGGNAPGISSKKYKLVLLGDSGVGKSCLVVRLCKDEYVQSLHSTVGSSFFKYSVDLNEKDPEITGNSNNSATAAAGGENNLENMNNNAAGSGSKAMQGSAAGQQVHFDIWDTAGQERFKSLARMYYRGAAAILVVYDITSVETFERAKLWVKELSAQESAVITLVGNKVDLDEDRAVPREEAAAFAAEHGIDCAEASAKTGQGVKPIFYQVAVKLAKSATAAAVSVGGVRATGGAGVQTAQPQSKKCPC